ncbi:ribonuclease H-like domain-containing protein, partial [Tanacetum coccineum]
MRFSCPKTSQQNGKSERLDTIKPNPRFHGHTPHISPLPKSPSVALSDPHWQDAMSDEYNALIKNGTWILVSKPPNVNVPATIRTVLSLALTRNWPIYQLDVKNAFLNGDLSETAPRAWFQRFVGYVRRVGFTSSQCDSSLFIYQHGNEKYAMDLLERAHMSNCNATRTPINTESKLSSEGDPVTDPTLYRSLV